MEYFRASVCDRIFSSKTFPPGIFTDEAHCSVNCFWRERSSPYQVEGTRVLDTEDQCVSHRLLAHWIFCAAKLKNGLTG